MKILYLVGVLGLLNFFPTGVFAASECGPLVVPQVVSSGGTLWSPVDNIKTKDGKEFMLGTQGRILGDDEQTSPTGGWVLLDMGCFADLPGTDVKIYEIGKTEGGEVYVGSAIADTSFSPNASGNQNANGWSRVAEQIPPHYKPLFCQGDQKAVCDNFKPFVCDGRESIPEAAEGCLSGDQWLNLNIGKEDGALYKYVYIWSDGSAKGDNANGGSRDFDVVEVTPPIFSVDLKADAGPASSGGASNGFGDIVSGAVPGVHVLYTISAMGGQVAGLAYEFNCGLPENKSVTGKLDATGWAEGLSCDYPLATVYIATVKVNGPLGEGMDSVRVETHSPIVQNVTNLKSKAGPPFVPFIFLTLAALILYTIITRPRT